MFIPRLLNCKFEVNSTCFVPVTERSHNWCHKVVTSNAGNKGSCMNIFLNLILTVFLTLSTSLGTYTKHIPQFEKILNHENAVHEQLPRHEYRALIT